MKTLLQRIIDGDPNVSIDLCWLVDNVGTAAKAWQEIEKAYAEETEKNKNK